MPNEVNLTKAIEVFGRSNDNTPSVDSLFTTRLVAGNHNFDFPTHYDPEKPINVIAYDDDLNENQADIGRLFEPGEVFIAVKHHRPSHPTLGSAERDEIKFDATHIEVGVGLSTASGNGAITINNPQGYQRGLFGDPSYPMMFLRLKFPDELSAEQKQQYNDNIRTWLLIANTYTNFPGNYDGGDPLATKSVGAIKILAGKLMDSLVGTEDEKFPARDWLDDPDNLVYCAELAHVAVNLGIHCPLNSDFLGDRTDAVKAAIASRGFLAGISGNPFARLVDLTMAPDSLEPIADALDASTSEPQPGEPFGKGLALKPLTLVDMIREFIQLIPREQLGEDVAAPLQKNLLEGIRPTLIEQVVGDANETDPQRQAAEALMDSLVNYIGTPQSSYQEFTDGLAPVLAPANEMTGPRPNGAGAFMPPHAWLLHALGKIDNAGFLLDVEVVGHGLHASMVQQASADPPPPSDGGSNRRNKT